MLVVLVIITIIIYKLFVVVSLKSTETEENSFFITKSKTKETLMEGERSGFLTVIFIKKSLALH